MVQVCIIIRQFSLDYKRKYIIVCLRNIRHKKHISLFYIYSCEMLVHL
jgi:hypothetical protein